MAAGALTQAIDEEIEKALARGEDPDYTSIADRVVEGGLSSRKARKEAEALGVTLRARYRLRDVKDRRAKTGNDGKRSRR